MRYGILLLLLACHKDSPKPSAALLTADGYALATEVRADTHFLSTGTRCIYSTMSDSTHALLPKQASSCIQQFYRWAGKQPH